MRHAGAVYGASKNAAPGSKHYYRPALSGGKWDEFLATRARGTILQVCTGGSRVGLARVDRDMSVPGVNCLAEMLALPFAADSFDTVAADPMYEIQYPDRVRLQRELFRVARSRLLFKSPWIPRGTGWTLKETVLVASHTCANVAVLSLLERVPNGELFV